MGVARGGLALSLTRTELQVGPGWTLAALEGDADVFSIHSSRETWMLTFRLPRGGGGGHDRALQSPRPRSQFTEGLDGCSAQDEVVLTCRNRSHRCCLRWQRSETQQAGFCGRTWDRFSSPSSFLKSHAAQRLTDADGGRMGPSVATPGLPECRPVGRPPAGEGSALRRGPEVLSLRRPLLQAFLEA